MYDDSDEFSYEVVLPPDSGRCQLRIYQTMEAEDMCAIFDDAWLGSRVWEATEKLCNQLSTAACGGKKLPSVVGRSVLELGSGTGIGGLVAAALGAKHVVMTDMASPEGTVNLIAHNIAANKPAIRSARCSSGGQPPPLTMCATALDWMVAPSDTWRVDHEPVNGFDVILAPECIYTGIDSGTDGSSSPKTAMEEAEASEGFESDEPGERAAQEVEAAKRPVWAALAETIAALARPHTVVVVSSMERAVLRPELRHASSDGGEATGHYAASLVVQFREQMEATHGFVCTPIYAPSSTVRLRHQLSPHKLTTHVECMHVLVYAPSLTNMLGSARGWYSVRVPVVLLPSHRYILT